MTNTAIRGITHELVANSFEESFEELRAKILKRGDLPYANTAKQLGVLNELSSFSLGRFFIERRGANGFWTDYIIENTNTKPSSHIEWFLLNACPLTLATRERFKIFQTQLQRRVKEGVHLTSAPCGLMRDLLGLDFSGINTFYLTGIDLDNETLNMANELAKKYRLEKKVCFIHGDAWTCQLDNPPEVITSNGLNVYVKDRQKVVSLYRNFYSLLKEGGELIMGFLTPPMEENQPTEWQASLLPKEDILMEKLLFQDILGCQWANFRSEKEVRNELISVGFTKISVIYDRYQIFPTVIAKK